MLRAQGWGTLPANWVQGILQGPTQLTEADANGLGRKIQENPQTNRISKPTLQGMGYLGRTAVLWYPDSRCNVPKFGVSGAVLSSIERQRKRRETPFGGCFVQLQRHCEACSRENSVAVSRGMWK